MMAQFYAAGGQASCIQLAETYGQTSDFYRMACGVHLAEKVHKETGCPLCNQENAKPCYFLNSLDNYFFYCR